MANESKKELRRLYWKAKPGRTIDKETNQVLYSMFSLRGTNMLALWNTKVLSYVFFGTKGLRILTKPAKYNKIPEINYSDISNVDIQAKSSLGYIILGILTCYTIILPIVMIWLLRNQVVTITSKYGPQTKIYTNSKKDAEMFVNELQAKIREAAGEQPHSQNEPAPQQQPVTQEQPQQ